MTRSHPQPVRHQPQPAAIPRRPAAEHLAAWFSGAPGAAMLLLLVTAAAYANSFQGTFVFDDAGHIHDRASVFRQFPHGNSMAQIVLGNRPTVALTVLLNYKISALQIWSYHAVNLLIHLAAALLLMALLRRALVSEPLRARFGAAATWLAAAAAAVWAVHPLNSSAVTYIIQRGESLMALCYLLALYCATRSVTPRRTTWLWQAGAVLACVLGAGAKEVIVTAPIVILLYDRTFLSGSFLRALKRAPWMYLGLAGTFFLPWYTLHPHWHDGGIGGVTRTISPLNYLLTQLGVILHYLRLALWPAGLRADYAWPLALLPGHAFPSATEVFAIAPNALVILALAGLTAWALWRRPALGFLGAWFFLILAPTSSVVPVADLAFEHRMYLPLAAVAALAVLGGYACYCRAAVRFPAFRPPLAAIPGVLLLTLIIGGLALATAVRNRVYRNETVYWQDVVDQCTDWPNPRAFNNLGAALLAQDPPQRKLAYEYLKKASDAGFPFVHRNLADYYTGLSDIPAALVEFDRAIAAEPEAVVLYAQEARLDLQTGAMDRAAARLARALKLDPSSVEALTTRGYYEQQLGHREQALACLHQAIEAHPEYAEAHLCLGLVLADGRDTLDQAEAQFNQALALAQTGPSALSIRARAQRGLGTVAQNRTLYEDAQPARREYNLVAAQYARRALALDPDLPEAHLVLGDALLQLEQVPEALHHLDVAGLLKPQDPSLRKTLADMASKDPDPGIRQGAQAVQLDLEAASDAGAGRYEQAAATAARAARFAAAAQMPDLAADIAARGQRYSRQRPWRDPP